MIESVRIRQAGSKYPNVWNNRYRNYKERHLNAKRKKVFVCALRIFAGNNFGGCFFETEICLTVTFTPITRSIAITSVYLIKKQDYHVV